MSFARLVLRELVRQPARTVGCVLAVGVGAAGYLLLVGAAEYLADQFTAMKRLLGAEVVVQRARATSPFSSSLTAQEVEQLAALPGVRGASRLAFGKTEVVGDHFFLLFGLESDPALAGTLRSLEGRLPLGGGDEAALGALAAGRLGLGLGATLEVRGRHLRVVGVYRCGHSLLDHGAVLPLDLVQQLFNLADRVNIVLLRVGEGAAAEELVDDINRHRWGVEASTTDAWISMYGEYALIRSYVRLVGLIALLVAALAVSSVTQVALVSRLGELAMLRAVGWSRARVGRLVVLEALAVAALGGLAAAPLGEWILVLAAPLNRETAGFVADHVNLALLPETLLLTLVAGGLGAVPPLLRVLRAAPARVLRMP